jgi:predicted transcriptional regulator
MFTLKEINRTKILQDVIDRNLRPGQAAEMLGITPRHYSRLISRYRQSGPLGVTNRSRGRPGNRRLPETITERVLHIIRETISISVQHWPEKNLKKSMGLF